MRRAHYIPREELKKEAKAPNADQAQQPSQVWFEDNPEEVVYQAYFDFLRFYQVIHRSLDIVELSSDTDTTLKHFSDQVTWLLFVPTTFELT